MAAVVDSLYAGYGECADMCAGEPSDTFCEPAPGGGYRGVNLTQMLSEGSAYLRREFLDLDYVLSSSIV